MAVVSVKTDPLYMQLNAAELTAIIMKDSPNSSDRDAGFCSASSESEGGDDLAMEHMRGNSSIVDTVDYVAKPMALVRNKRKSSEPSKVVESLTSSSSSSSSPLALASPSSSTTSSVASACTVATGPLKKRIRYTSSADSAVVLTPPAGPTPPPSNLPPPAATHMWDPSQVLPHELMPHPAQIFVRHPGVTTLHRGQPEQQEPLALVLKKQPNIISPPPTPIPTPSSSSSTSSSSASTSSSAATSASTPPSRTPKPIVAQQSSPSKKSISVKKLPRETTTPLDLQDMITEASSNHPESLGRPQQRNYKNMTRERRIEANARERTRVHTISAAYETLRQAVPAYASSQKLSKLSVLRVACSYILTLSRMAGEDYSADQSEPSIADCIEAVTSTIQTEGKVKRKKDE